MHDSDILRELRVALQPLFCAPTPSDVIAHLRTHRPDRIVLLSCTAAEALAVVELLRDEPADPPEWDGRHLPEHCPRAPEMCPDCIVPGGIDLGAAASGRPGEEGT